MGVVREPMAEWELDILKCLADEKPNNVGLTGGQLLEILSRLEQAEQAVQLVRYALEDHSFNEDPSPEALVPVWAIEYALDGVRA